MNIRTLKTKALLICLAMISVTPLNAQHTKDESTDAQRDKRHDYSIPVIDLNDESKFHSIVAKDLDRANQYLGHPTTVLLDDGKTIIAAFPTGHGRGELRFRRSRDAGKTWQAMKAPDVDLHETPTLFKTARPDGKTRIVLTTCVPKNGRVSLDGF